MCRAMGLYSKGSMPKLDWPAGLLCLLPTVPGSGIRWLSTWGENIYCYKNQHELNRCRMYVFLHAIPLFSSGVLPEAQYVECKWVWSGLVKMSGTCWAAVCDPSIALGWSQASWISPRWDLHAQLLKYMRLYLKWSRTISGNLNQSP